MAERLKSSREDVAEGENYGQGWKAPSAENGWGWKDREGLDGDRRRMSWYGWGWMSFMVSVLVAVRY